MTANKAVVWVLGVAVAGVFLSRGLGHVGRLSGEESRFDLLLAAQLTLAASSVAGGRVELSWEVTGLQADVEKYEYQSGSLGSPLGPWMAMELENAARRVTVDGLSAGAVYAFRMKVTDENGIEYLSNQAVAAIELLEAEVETVAGLCDGAELGVVHFELGRSEIDEGYRGNERTLRMIANRLRQEVTGGRLVLVVGYASGDGVASFNLDLSERRAREVARDLSEERGVAALLVPLAMGERHDEPVLGRENERNRRVVVGLCSREADE